MIQLAWRQFRAQAVVAFGLLAAIAVALAVTGPQLVHLYDASVVPCAANNDCAAAEAVLTGRFRLLQGLGTVLVIVPGLAGVFWGAPLLARELETGTYKLTWTQSVTRKRWLGVKLALVGLSSIAVAGLLSLMLTWWSSPIDRVNDDPFGLFDERGIVPLGYAAFAFALGVAAGMLLRRTVPAMVTTLAVFAGVRTAIDVWVRPRLLATSQVISKLQMPAGNGAGNVTPPGPGDWVISDLTVDGTGKVIGQDGTVDFGGGRYGIGISVSDGRASVPGAGACPNKFPAGSLFHGANAGPPPGMSQAVQECYARLDIRQVLTYQPTSHYWPLQWYELAIFTGLALVLAVATFVWLRRRFA